jgi:hypothetical protein
MNKHIFLVLLFTLQPLNAPADTTLTYESFNQDGTSSVETYNIHGRWVRIDADKAGEDRHYLLDTGHMTLYVVDHNHRSYAIFGKLSLAREDGSEQLQDDQGQLTLQRRTSLLSALDRDDVAGFKCQRIDEMKGEAEVSRHCMADAKALDITPEELKSMARLFAFNRDVALLNHGAAHVDERVISIRSVASDGSLAFRLKSVSTQPLPRETFQIPVDYVRVEPSVFMADVVLGDQPVKSPACATGGPC